MKHLFPTLAVTTALVALPAFAGGQFKDMDADANGSVSMTEFDTGMQDAGWFMQWNTNGDDTLSRDEFQTGLYGLCDADANKELSNSEFESCVSVWMGDQGTQVSFADLDADSSDSLSEDEFASGIEQSQLFEEIAGMSGGSMSGGSMAGGSSGTTSSGSSGSMASGRSGTTSSGSSGTASSGASGSSTMASDDQGITEDAFKQGLFDRFDQNSDGMLSQDEIPQLSGMSKQ